MAMETINALTDDMESGTFPRESTYGSLEKSEHDDVTSMNEQDEKSHPAHNEHLQKTRQYYRDMMLGVNDGLVSTLLLVAGVVGGMSYVINDTFRRRVVTARVLEFRSDGFFFIRLLVLEVVALVPPLPRVLERSREEQTL